MIQATTQLNRCSKILIALLTTLTLLFALDYYVRILFLNGVFLFAYLSCVVTASILATTVIIQHVLKLNKPVDYDAKRSHLKLLRFAYNYFWAKSAESNIVDDNAFGLIKDGNIDERIAEFVEDVKQRFVLNWYREISDDEQFLSETEKLLDEVLRRFLQIVVAVDNRALVQGVLVILLKHVKEFKKAKRRAEKTGGCIEDSYRYAHVASNSEETYEQFISQLTTKLLKQFVSSELWTSLIWRTLVSILSRKLTTTSLNYVSQPGLINYALVSLCATDSAKKELELHKKAYISLSNAGLSGGRRGSRKPAPEAAIKKEFLTTGDGVDGCNTPRLSPKKKHSADVEKKPKKLETEAASARSSRTVSEPVKIYQSSSDKTWRNSSDLESVSLGEDLLALQEIADPDSEIQSLIERKLWKDSSDSQEVEDRPHTIFETIFGEDDESVSPSNIQTATQIFTNTMKPIGYRTKIFCDKIDAGHVTANTIQNMKDFQQTTVNTVNNSVVKPITQVTNSAKHKIGDLQDEAAGVMEGILDFGMAGLRKGLRLTGLQDNLGELGKKGEKREEKPARKLTKFSQAVCEEDGKLEKTSSNESADESVWVNPLVGNNNKFSPNFDGHILLEKSPVTSEGSVAQEIPSISMDLDISTSPDLEYEDTTDLATTTAKLRSLLAQKTSESAMTTPAISPMPQDDKVTPSIERLVAGELTDVDGVMPSLYKFYNKTATGLQQTFNTIKTALPGNEKLEEHKTAVDSSRKWQYVPDSKKNSLFRRMEQLLSERRDYCVIDPAYDYIELLDQTDGLVAKNHLQFDVDDLDEFDLQIPMAKTLLEIVCELLSDADTCLTQEPVMKCCLVLCGKILEDKLNEESQFFIRNVNSFVRRLPESSLEMPMGMKIEKMVEYCLAQAPGYLVTLLGRTTLEEGVKILITSFQYIEINRDVFLQVFELCTTHLVKVNNLMSPTYSA